MQYCTCNSQLSLTDRFCPNCGMATPYNTSQGALNDPTVATPQYQPPLISLYSAPSPPPPPPPPFYSTGPSEAAARQRKWHWRNTFVAVLITTILLIAASMVIPVQRFHLFGFNQHPTSNPLRISPTANSSFITNNPSISPTLTITRNNNTGNIFDAAGILNQNQVRSAETSLRYPVDIYTTQNFSGTSNQFEQRARGHLTNAKMIVIAISTSPRYMTVVAGSAVPLSNSEAGSVISSFRNSYQNSGGNFTSATVSALQQLQNLLA